VAADAVPGARPTPTPGDLRPVVRCHDEEASPSRLAYDLRNWFVTMVNCEAGYAELLRLKA